MQRQKPRGTSRRKFITRSIAGGAIAIIGTTVVGSVLVNLSSSFNWHREIISEPAAAPIIHPPIHPTIAWSPDAKQFAVISPDNSFVEMYSIDSDGAPLYLTNLQDQYYTAPINTLAWSPDGSRLATGTTDGSIDIRFIKGGFGPINFFPLKYPTNDDGGAIDGLVWSPDSKLLAICGSGQLISICNAQSGKIIFQQQLTSANRTGLFSWSPDSNRFVIENGLPDHPPFRPALQVWNVKTGKMVLTLKDFPGLSAAWSPDGNTIATLSEDGNVFLWNAENGSYIKTLVSSVGKFVDLLWSPDSQNLALETEFGYVQVWHVQNYLTHFYPVHAGLVRAWIWLHDGRIALVDDTKTVQYLKVDLS